MTTQAGGSGGQAGDLFGHLFTTDDLWEATSGQAWVDAMLDFERELAMAEAEAGLVLPRTAEVIVEVTRDLRVDPVTLGRDGRDAGNPAVPLVRMLREAVGPEVAPSVHLGATSQDVIDTAAMLVARRSGTLIVMELDRAADTAARLADEHRSTVLAGRTLLQQALPTTFGLKAAGWLVALDDAGRGLRRVLEDRLAVQLGGAVGSLASLGGDGPRVAGILARRLGLAQPVLPWHTDRSRVGELASALTLAAGAGAKVALDVTLLSQTEVQEVSAGSGGSSTLPHKQNPVQAVIATADARRAAGLAGMLLSPMAQEHERAAGAWHAEWPTLVELLRASGGCVASVSRSLDRLRIDPARMRENLDLSHGALMAERVLADLAPGLGWDRAREAVSIAIERVRSQPMAFAQALSELEAVAEVRSSTQLEALCDPTSYLGAADALVDRALAEHRRHRDG